MQIYQIFAHNNGETVYRLFLKNHRTKPHTMLSNKKRLYLSQEAPTNMEDSELQVNSLSGICPGPYCKMILKLFQGYGPRRRHM